MNIVLGIVSILVTFGCVVLFEKLFKKEGLFVWVSFATITANILVCKSVDFLGFTTSLGNVLFASNFLATDILCEKYTSREGRKAIVLGVAAQVMFLLCTWLAIEYTPSAVDQTNESMKTLFSINLRVSLASLTMYFLSNMLDIYLFEKLRQKFPQKLWLRNNVSTMLANCLENYVFSSLAFIGIYRFGMILQMATVASVIEMLLAICDTPFLYLAKKIE